jgi:Thioredoxin
MTSTARYPMRSLTAFLFLFALTAASGADTLRELFDSGQTYEVFLEAANRRKAMWHANTEKAQVPDSMLERAAAVPGTWHLLVVAVDGCSDSANTIPYLADLASALDGVDMRIVHPRFGDAIMNSHPTPDGRGATPTVILLNAQFEEVGAFVERPAPLQEWALANKDQLDPDQFLVEKAAWYDQDLGRTTMEEVVLLMEAAVSEQ